MISYEKIDWDSAVANFGYLPKTRTNPLGTTVLYSNQNQINHPLEK
jgi:hypothetical protein